MLTLEEFFHMMIDALLEGVEEKYGRGAVDKPVAPPVQGDVQLSVKDAAGMSFEISCKLQVENDEAIQAPGGFPG